MTTRPLRAGRLLALVFAFCACWVAPARANKITQLPYTRRVAVGIQFDLFPTVVSAANGRFGGAPQVWVGIDHVRLRLVGAHLEPPNALAFADKGFKDPTTTAFAALVDYTFGENFDGFWIGGGFEQWTQTIGHEGVSGIAQWSRTVVTVGGGYIFRLPHNFIIDPWIGLHALLNPSPVMVDTYKYEQPVVVPSASVKVGWFLEL